MTASDAHFAYTDDPELPGWKRWELRDTTRFNAILGPLWVRLQVERTALVRWKPDRCHANLQDSTHGGALLGFMDISLFAAAHGLGVTQAGRAVTLDLSAQFIGTSHIDRPILAELELLRETGRLLFMRGMLTQDDVILASFSATVRKFTARA